MVGIVGQVRTADESTEQQFLFYHLANVDLLARYPELRWVYAIPNGATVISKREGTRLKTEGLKPGVPDLCLPVARRGYHGLYIELKRKTGTFGDLSSKQVKWINFLREQGYIAVWRPGWEAALKTLVDYLDGEFVD